jgi:hypothetical protein
VFGEDFGVFGEDFGVFGEDFGVFGEDFDVSLTYRVEELDGIKKSTTTHTVHDNTNTGWQDKT